MNQLTEELRILKLDLPKKGVVVLELLLNEIGRTVSEQYLLDTAGCTDAMLRYYIKLLRQHGCTIQTHSGKGFRLERLPGGEEPK